LAGSVRVRDRACQCGTALPKQDGPGRRRIRCLDCDPRTEHAHPCKGCGKSIGRRKFCTNACREQFYTQNAKALDEARRRARGAKPIEEVRRERREAALQTCKACGDRFLKRNGDAAWDHCSKACATATQRANMHITAARREFARWANPNRIFGYAVRIAQLRAGIEAKRQRAAVACGTCGSPIPEVGNLNKRYCSKQCSPSYWSCRRKAKALRRARMRRVEYEQVDPFVVFDRDGWRCHLCGTKTDKALRGTHEPLAPELDHIIPLSKGGPHTYSNTACSCRRCNHAKADNENWSPELLVA
jgi:hypothetical protein